MRTLLALVVVPASILVAHASSPGQPLDCSDLQFDVPGLTCRVLAPFGSPMTTRVVY